MGFVNYEFNANTAIGTPRSFYLEPALGEYGEMDMVPLETDPSSDITIAWNQMAFVNSQLTPTFWNNILAKRRCIILAHITGAKVKDWVMYSRRWATHARARKLHQKIESICMCSQCSDTAWISPTPYCVMSRSAEGWKLTESECMQLFSSVVFFECQATCGAE